MVFRSRVKEGNREERIIFRAAIQSKKRMAQLFLLGTPTVGQWEMIASPGLSCFFFLSLQTQWAWARNRDRESLLYCAGLWAFFHPSMLPFSIVVSDCLFTCCVPMLGASQLLVEDGSGERENLVEIPLSRLPGINLGWEIMGLWVHRKMPSRQITMLWPYLSKQKDWALGCRQCHSPGGCDVSVCMFHPSEYRLFAFIFSPFPEYPLIAPFLIECWDVEGTSIDVSLF